jgi:hypothetical protein
VAVSDTFMIAATVPWVNPDALPVAKLIRSLVP